jgi:hypothetical protein
VMRCEWAHGFVDTPDGRERWMYGWIFPGDRCAHLDLELMDYRLCLPMEGP